MIKRTIEESKPKHKKVNFYTASFFFLRKIGRFGMYLQPRRGLPRLPWVFFAVLIMTTS